MKFRISLLVALLLVASTAHAASLPSPSLHSTEPLHVATFTLSELQEAQRQPSTKLQQALRTTGLIAVTPTSSSSLLSSVLQDTMCPCWSSLLKNNNEADASEDNTNNSIVPNQAVQSVWLPDQRTQRVTLATATVGHTPLPLPEDHLTSACGPDAVQALEALRDQVATVSTTFVQALDELLVSASSSSSSSRGHALLRNSYGTSYPTVQSIVEASKHLEHFHWYSKQQKHDLDDESSESTSTTTSSNADLSQQPASLPLHSDAGLFLTFVPGQTCSSLSSPHQSEQQQEHQDAALSSSFWVQDETGVTRPVVFPAGSIAVMLGAGAEHWLDLPHSRHSGTSDAVVLRATRHAVHMAPGQERAWYGMMHLVPDHAVVQTHPVQRTFAQMREEMALHPASSSPSPRSHQSVESDSAISIGCGIGADGEDAQQQQQEHDDEPDDLILPSRRRRRLQHVGGPEDCNNSTNFFCWMSCLEIPQAQQAAAYINEGYSLYCLDPSVLASSGNRVSQAIEPCMEAGEVGRAMNPICMGSWQPTAPGNVPFQQVNLPSDSSSTQAQDEPFCYGGTSMYMDGFQFLGSTCAIYLFPGWVLSSAFKLFVACVGSVIFGAALEYIIYQRRQMMLSTAPGTKRLLLSATYYGVQLAMGYSVMLVVMIYSVPLFVSIIVGLVLGHVLFNAKDSLIGSSKSSEGNAASTKEQSGRDPLSSGATHVERTLHNSSDGSSDGCCRDNAGESFVIGKGDHSSDDGGVPEGSTPCCQYNP